jgi:hypothetical protein
MSYELQVHALSPLRPTPRELLARTGESGLAVGMTPVPGAPVKADDSRWTQLLLRSEEAPKGGFLVELASAADHERVKRQFLEDREAGESVPDQVLEARALFVLELDDEAPGGEDHQAAFVVAAWALASLTDAVVFDPQEEFFADADSFWAILTDESLGDEGCGDGPDGDDDDDDDDDDEDQEETADDPPMVHRLTVLPGGSGRDATDDHDDDRQERNRE